MAHMQYDVPAALGLIAGKGVYPLLFAEAAKKQGVKRLFALAFRGETERRISRLADETVWINLGQYGRMLDAIRSSGIRQFTMAGQITPTNLFRIRLDSRMIALLRRLKVRNAESIFGAVGEDLASAGVELTPASLFMEEHIPSVGCLTGRRPDEAEMSDIALGFRIAYVTSGLDIGQTVVVKRGTVLAVEAFEGTDAAIRRAGKLGGPGSVVVKTAKQGHDMRFDIPVVGVHTLRTLKRAGAGVLAVEAGRCILLEKERIAEQADRQNLVITAVDPIPAGGERE
jgi:DUF1009 family protein